MSSNAEPAQASGSGGAPGVAAGRLVVISSPSGGGKGTLIRRVLQMVPDLGYSISFTTRPARSDETHGREYFFISTAEFLAMHEAGGFLESAVVHGNHYGTARVQIESELQSGRDVVLEIDVQGAELVRAREPGALTIFILPPSYEVLAERLTARGTENPDDIRVRLHNSRGEVERYREFQYVVVNDDAVTAASQLATVIMADRASRERQELAAQRVLETFIDTAGQA
jgi:guanylate kinase